MDEAYSEWQKDENRGKDKWDVLNGFSKAHQIAVVFGNFNYQVENGGISQWIYNGYFHDDAEKLTEYLEIGAEVDERCRTILGKLYALDRYARETGCDRDGYYRDPDDEDGDSLFIGDMIDCDGFDTWYYESCGNDDWWDVICGIIDKAEAHELAQTAPHERGEEDINTKPPLIVYIENAARPEIGGFTIPLPITPEELSPWLEGIVSDDSGSVAIKDVTSYLSGLAKAVWKVIPPGGVGDTLSELNYLAAQIKDMDTSAREILLAVLEAGWHSGSVAEIINLTENIGVFELQPALDAKMYGEFRVETAFEDYDGVIGALYMTGDDATEAFADFVRELQNHIDLDSYGKSLAREENGAFTKYGYLTESASAYKEAYRGTEDIPAEYRLSTESANEPLVKVSNVDLATLLTAMHAVGGDHARDIQGSLRTLYSGAEDYFVMMNSALISVIPAQDIYRREIMGNAIWLGLRPEADVRLFQLAAAGRDGSRIMGSLYELDIAALQETLRDYSYDFTHIDAEMRDGAELVITFDAWNAMDSPERGEVRSHVYHHDPADVAQANAAVQALRRACEEKQMAVSPENFLLKQNSAYMAGAEHPVPDMLRITRDAASDILARGGAEVYRLLPAGPEKLSPMDAVRSGGLWFSEHREYAIRCDDLPALTKWAERAAAEIFRQTERGEHNKSRGEEL
jgi:hypothetical protein